MNSAQPPQSPSLGFSLPRQSDAAPSPSPAPGPLIGSLRQGLQRIGQAWSLAPGGDPDEDSVMHSPCL